jgi:hypothetical protein
MNNKTKITGCRMMRQKENPIIKEPGERETMNCLEIITVRVAENNELENALDFCTQVFHTIESGEIMNLSVYCSTGYGSDLSVHIHCPFEPSRQEKSLLGLQLAKGLSAFGIVSHTLWIDKEIILK